MIASPQFTDLVTATPENPRSGEGDMVVLRDGTVFFAYTSFQQARDDARADIVCRTSEDGGATWGEPRILVPNDEASENVMSVCLLRLESGGILMFYLRKDSRTLCRAWMRRSDDEAQTWSDAVCCTPDESYYCIVNNCATQLTDGRVLLPYSVCDEIWTPNERLIVGTAISDDEGATWQQSNTVYAPKRGAMEPRIVEKMDGQLWMLLRTDQGSIWQCTSDDRGATWCEPTNTGIEAPQAPFVFTRIPATGDLLLIRNPVANLTQGTHQGYRTPLAASISKDDGETWLNEKLLESDTGRTYCYLSTTFLDDTVLFSYYQSELDAPVESLRVARVPIAWFYE